ncbi:MAG TPA: TetR family transcriptional regulator [Polyangiaceae bacterium]|nr:TetR family transcriptional regulator [Polyangiaceae bacterium]
MLDAARLLLDEAGLEGVGLNAIGREVGLSKSNLYRYFESREDILLHLFVDEHEQWAAAVEKGLAPLAGTADIQAIAQTIVRETLARPRLGQLGSVLSSVLERNVSEAVVVWFKSTLSGDGLRVCNALIVAAPRLTAERARRLLDAYYALVAGLWPMCHPSESVRAALNRPELAHMRHDFERDGTDAFALMLRGSLGDLT